MINVIMIWALIALFILQPGIAHDGAETGVKLFVQALLPYLLPYIILTQWLLKLPVSKNSSPTWMRYVKAYTLGSFGGFPVGAVTVSEMKRNGQLSTYESSLLLAACHAPGPMFIVGYVGLELFGNTMAGWKLLIAIHVANILFFLFVLLLMASRRSKHPVISNVPVAPPSSAPLLDAFKESSSIIILVATTVVFFSSLGNVLTSVIQAAATVEMGIVKTAVLSLFEMTSGVQSATQHFYGSPLFPYLIAAILSINGLSIHMQVFVIARTAELSLKPYVIGRIWSVLAVPVFLYIIL
ncbi:hypothetical protein [Sporosarcina gallistercoris]|uniref:Sporulation integral membrane protein YlbJ n=1 Tax=Sporosarcina gallistercoris TaxID=2762245 RepID=A0ABR8PGD3_9BACL|nr:hypothetical protein [Sporosarcina gallistercoris]MBD7907231.1 hypothetical protein [Sporosarcina gallistercoris]